MAIITTIKYVIESKHTRYPEAGWGFHWEDGDMQDAKKKLKYYRDMYRNETHEWTKFRLVRERHSREVIG